MNIAAQSQALRQLAGHLVADAASADDLAQDAWVDALRSPSPEARPTGGWLRTVLRNRRVTNYRAAERRVRREEHADPPQSPPSAEQLQVARELLEHLAALPEADRDLLTMHYWEALSLQECAERLELSPSTVRSRHARALSKLRARLDEHAGGRAAWLAALAPWVVRPAARGVSGGLASLTVGGVLAGALLWVLAAVDPGCGAANEAAVASPGDEHSSPVEHDVRASMEDTTVPASHRDDQPSEQTAAQGVDFKHACDMPIAPEDAPSMAAELRSGKKLSSEEFIKAYSECVRRHGPPSDYTSPQENEDGTTHPLLSATMSMRFIWPAMRDCYAGRKPARARISYAFRMHEDGAMTIGDVDIEESERLDADQRACIVDSFAVAELDLRPGDATQLGLDPGTEVVMPRIVGVELVTGEDVDIYASGFRPLSVLRLEDPEAFVEGIADCGPSLPAARLHWDPETGSLLDVDAGTGQEADCLQSLLRAQLRPLERGFFPTDDRDMWQTCRFDEGRPKCETEPLFEVVEASR